MLNQFSRTELLLGQEAMDILQKSRVAIFGIGGVGGFCCEALVRTGVGHFDLVDDDKVCLTNLNRQVIATRKTVGRDKADVMKERMLEINPKADIRLHKTFFLPENAGEFSFKEYDYVVDAVDTVTAKIEIIMQAKKNNVPVISCTTFRSSAAWGQETSWIRHSSVWRTSIRPRYVRLPESCAMK